MKPITKLPPFLVVCPSCKGAGHYAQTYTAGCGGGNYTTEGPCEQCSNTEAFCGPGLLYAGGGKVTFSIIAQVLTLNQISLSPSEWTVERQVASSWDVKPIELSDAHESQ